MANSQTITINIKGIADMSDVLSSTKQIQNALSQLKLPNNLTQQFTSNFSNIEREAAKVQAILAKPVKTKADLSGLDTSFKKINTELQHLQTGIGKIDPSILKESFQIDTSKLQAATKEVEKWQNALKQKIDTSGLNGVLEAFKEFQATGKNNKWVDSFVKAFQSGDIKGAEEALKGLNSQVRLFEGNAAKSGGKWVQTANDYSQVAQKFGEALDKLKTADGVDNIVQKLQQAQTALSSLSQNELQNFINAFQTQGPAAALQVLIDKTRDLEAADRDSVAAQVQLNSELNQVKSRIQYFLGLSNAVNLFKRAIRGAVNTVKELDKAMTETAVVTDFSVGDMWAQLPRYTKVANELGVTTKGAYETMTLFYQQGLKTDEAFALGTQTMKMARIAGMDYTEATDAMTAALRGFNMELNETSAQRVNDVYSQLAAKTASNVEEISTAMTKTASIAHNAGMEFETTSAYLSQIIETTREAPETAGTALKTVIARFTELKKPLEEISEVEGEVVDANKIETALKSVGVALRDAQGEFRDLDDVFLDLNKKWDSLSKNQQRYVATMAAGSRQQSRFIAMMSNYGRTQELIGEAYNANGASQKQYEKTLDSLESKLNKLKNAWNEFLMGLANSTLVKAGVDVLTLLLNIVNKVTGAFGDGVGFILKWGAAIGTILGLKHLFKEGGLVTNLLGKFGTTNLAKFLGLSNEKDGKGLIGGANKAARITIDAAQTFKSIIIAAANEAAGIEVAGEAKGAGIEAAGEAEGAAISAGSHAASTGIGAWLAGGAAGGAHAAGGLALSGFGALGIAAIVAAVIGLTGYGIYKSSPQGQLDSAEKLSESLAAAADSARQLKDTLSSIPETYEEYTNAINSASSTQEREEAIQKRNNYLTSLMEQNPDFTSFIKTGLENSKIVLSIDEKQLEKELSSSITNANRDNALSYFSQASVAAQNAAVYDNRLKNIELYNTENGLAGRTLWTFSNGVTTTGRTLTSNEVSRAEADQQQLIKYATEAIQKATEGYLLLLEGTDLDDSIAEGLASALGKQFNSADFLRSQAGKYDFEFARLLGLDKYGTDTSGEWNLNAKDYADVYELLTGDKYGGTTRWWSSKDKEAARSAANRAMYAQDQNQILQQLTNLTQSNEKLYGPIFSALSGKAIEDLRFGQQDLASSLGLKDGELSTALNQLSQFIPTIQQDLEEQNRVRRESQQNKLIDATASLKTRGITGLDFDKLYGLTFGAQDYILNILSSIENAGLGIELGNALINELDKVDLEDSELASWINNIDFSNPIEAMSAISSAADNATGKVQEVANALLNVEDGISASDQVQYFLTSSEFQDINEELEEFVEENGRIDSTKVKDLAKQHSNLNKLLHNGAIEANGLANILNAMSSGAISVLDVNDALIAAANPMGALDDITAETIAGLNNFSPSYDENDVTKFISSTNDFVKEQLEQGSVGNEALRNYMDFIFGGGSGDITGLTGDEYVAKLKENQKWLEDNKDDMYSAWHDAIKAFDSSGEVIEGLKVFEEASKIKIDFGDMTTDELNQALSEWGEIAGLSQQQIAMMFADYKNYSDDLEVLLAKDDLPAALEEWSEELGSINGGQKFATPEQISALKALAEAAGFTEEEFDSLFQKLKEEKGILERTFEGSNILEQLRELNYGIDGYTSKVMTDQHFKESDYIDVAQLKTDLQSAGMYTQQTFDEAVNAAFESLGTDASSFVVEIGDKMVEVTVGAEETASEALQRALEETSSAEAYEAIGKAMGESFVASFTESANELPETVNNATQANNDLATSFANAGDSAELAGEQVEEFGQKVEHSHSAGKIESEVATTTTTNEVVNQTTNTQVNVDTTQVDEAKQSLNELDAEANTEKEAKVDTESAQSEIDETTQSVQTLHGILGQPTSLQVNTNAAYNSIITTRRAWENWTPTIKYAKVVTIKEGSVAKGGQVSSYASGSFKVQPGPALTGEEGPEIVWNKEKGYAYITGQNHPEFQLLYPGDRIFNAQETRKILGSAASGGIVNSYAIASGYGRRATTVKTSSSSSGGGSSSGSSTVSSEEFEEFRNDLDWLYNLVEDIAEMERTQTRLQEEYEASLKDNTKTLRDTYQLQVKQVANLNAQLRAQEHMQELREQEMDNFMQYTNLFPEYLQYNWEDRTLEIDWDAIERITDAEVYNQVSEMVQKAESIQDTMDSAEDRIREIKAEIEDINRNNQDRFIDLYKQVREALIQSYQDNIDAFGELNDTINDTNSRVISSLQEQVSLSRQIRDNTKTEEDIRDLEARIAYLRRDNTGSNTMEIMQLEKELEDKRQSYSDNLIDQSIDNLQKSNDDAAEQRERQIDIMQHQLDYWVESGGINIEVDTLIDELMSGLENHNLVGSRVLEILKGADGWTSLAQAEKTAWADELIASIKEAFPYYTKTLSQDAKEEQPNQMPASMGGPGGINNMSGTTGTHSQSYTTLGPDSGSETEVKQLQEMLVQAGYSLGGYNPDGQYGQYTEAAVRRFQAQYGLEETGIATSETQAKLREVLFGSNTNADYASDSSIYPYYRDLSKNSSEGADTWALQRALVELGYANFEPDGLIGNKTLEAAKAFQKDMGIDSGSDNVLGYKSGQTLDLLNQVLMLKHEAAADGVPVIWWKKNGGWLEKGMSGPAVQDLKNMLVTLGFLSPDYNQSNVFGEQTEAAVRALQAEGGLGSPDGKAGSKTNDIIEQLFKKKGITIKRYLTGGLNSQPGFAWLDGTSTKPEAILNAVQTKAFLKLADVLPSIMSSSVSGSNFANNIYLNLTMNVDEIGSDYDVDRIAERVKDIVYNASSYRNVNTLNFRR